MGCFPATPKAGWDWASSSPAQPARVIDLRTLDLLDGLTFEGRRPVAVHGFAAVLCRLHEANGCTEPLGQEHFTRQLQGTLMVRLVGGVAVVLTLT